jgi:RHS repeat-associated protein
VERKLPSGERYRYFYDSTGKPEKTLYPDGSCSVANYDQNGRLLRTRDRREISTFLSYNKADLPVKKIGFGNRTLTIDTLHTQHGPARITQSEFIESQAEVLQEQYEYHWTGAVEKISQAADSKTRTLESTYDAAGNQVAVKATSAGGWSKELAIDPQYHPGGADTDPFNRVAVLDGGAAKVILEGSFLGLPSKTKYGSTPAREVAYGYDLLLRLKSLVSNEGTPELNVQMTRDFVGNLLTRESSNYSYDGLHRMVIGEAESYAYDELSNLSRRGSRTYTYQAAGERDQNQMRLAAYNDGSEHALGYDREGNVVSLEDRFDELVYDNLGRLREITHTSQTDKYGYDAEGLRFRREEGGEVVYTLHNGDWILFQEKYSSGVLAESRFNLLAGGQIVGQLRKVGANDPVYLFFCLDNLGSRRVVWNEDGTVKVKFNYSAGGEFSRVGGVAADEWLASFTGKEYDATGLLYFNARYYDPILGRFLSEDPSRKGHSWYTYCNNNPLTFTDPTGRLSDYALARQENRQYLHDARRTEADRQTARENLRQEFEKDRSEHPERYDRPSSPLTQQVLPNGKTECLARVLMHEAEKASMINFTAGELVVMSYELKASGALSEDNYVRDADAVLKMAFSKMGLPEAPQVSRDPAGARSSVLKLEHQEVIAPNWAMVEHDDYRFVARSHYQSGTEAGFADWDPWGRDLSSNYNDTEVRYYVHY